MPDPQHDTRLLMGFPAIANFLGITPRQAKHLAAKGVIPVFKLPKTRLACARAETLESHLASQEAAALQSNHEG